MKLLPLGSKVTINVGKIKGKITSRVEYLKPENGQFVSYGVTHSAGTDFLWPDNFTIKAAAKKRRKKRKAAKRKNVRKGGVKKSIVARKSKKRASRKPKKILL